MKIVVLDGYAENPGDLSWDGFRELGETVVYDRTPEDQIMNRMKDAPIVYTNKTPITRDTIKACSQLKYIGVLATGYNVVDLEAAKEAGIIVTNIPSYGTAAVAQYTIALLLEMCHHIGAHADAVKQGQWTNSKDFCFWNYPLIELEGKTMGIIGFGRIGQAVARIAQVLGMKVLVHSRTRKVELETETCSFVSLEQIFTESDIISLHCPLLPETEGIINQASIETMKDGVMLINTARGPLIVEKDLKEALDCGKIKCAALDVVSKEPITKDNPLLNAKNCLITPHIAWASIESRQRLMSIAVENLKAFLDGKPIHVVNL